MNNYTIYEQPLNERIRTFLRLEELFKQNETIKELERYTVTVERLEKRPHVDELKLKQVIDELGQHIRRLHNISGKIGASLRDVQLIAIVRQRSEIPGGTFNFDIPMYHFWLDSTPEQRHQQLKIWLSDFEPIKEALALLLGLIRGSGSIESEVAESGFFQKGLEVSNPCQLIRVFLKPDSKVFPEISGSKHRVSIRFLQSNLVERPSQTAENVMFDLSCCVF